MSRRAGPCLPPTADDPAARNRDVASEGRLSAAVDNGATANDDIVHAGLRGSGTRIMRRSGSLDNEPWRMSDSPAREDRAWTRT